MRALLILGFVTAVLWQPAAAQRVTITGRDTPGNLDSHEFLRHEFADARMVKGLYCDEEDHYLVYRVRMIHYQRCEVSADLLDEWLQSDSPDSYFRCQIEESHECTSGNTLPL